MLDFFRKIRNYNPSGAQVPASLLGIVNLSTILWVDAVNGSDTTGTKGSILKPYQTLIAAKNAASSGDYIKAVPGTHTTNTTLAKDGIIYDLVGSTVNFSVSGGNMLGDGGSQVNYKIIGGTLNQNNTNGILGTISNANSIVKIVDATITDNRAQLTVARGSFKVLNGAQLFLERCVITADNNVSILAESGGVITCTDCEIYGGNDLTTACVAARGTATVKLNRCKAESSGSIPTINLAETNGGINTIEMTDCIVTNTSSGLAFNTEVSGQIIKLLGSNTFVVNTSTYAIKFVAGATQDVDIFNKLISNKDVDPSGSAINVRIGEYVVDSNVSYSN